MSCALVCQVLTYRAEWARAASDLWAVALTVLCLLPGRCQVLLQAYHVVVGQFRDRLATADQLIQAAKDLRTGVCVAMSDLGMSPFFRHAMNGLLAVEEAGEREEVMSRCVLMRDVRERQS